MASQKPRRATKRRAKEVIEVDLDASSEDELGDELQDIQEELQPSKNDEDRLDELTGHYASQAVQEESSGLTPAEEDKLVRACMRYMLFKQMQKPGVPVRRDELNKLIPNTYKSQRIHNLGRYVVQKAQAKFPEIFGMEMKELSSSTGARGSSEGSKIYVLRSLLNHSLRSMIRMKEQEHNQAFLMVILPLILLAGGKLPETDLKIHMEKIGVDTDGWHQQLGKVSEKLQLLVQKKYLSEQRETGVDGSYKVYAVGPHAIDEIQEDNVKGFMDAVFKKTSKVGS